MVAYIQGNRGRQTMYQLHSAGIEAFDIFTKSGRFAGIVVQKPAGHHVLYWDSNASRGSARKFPTRQDALEFMHQRRVKKGWRVE
jgi:hypothetical protein